MDGMGMFTSLEGNGILSYRTVARKDTGSLFTSTGTRHFLLSDYSALLYCTATR